MKAEQELAGVNLLQLAADPGVLMNYQLQLRKAVPEYDKCEQVQLTWEGLVPCRQV